MQGCPGSCSQSAGPAFCCCLTGHIELVRAVVRFESSARMQACCAPLTALQRQHVRAWPGWPGRWALLYTASAASLGRPGGRDDFGPGRAASRRGRGGPGGDGRVDGFSPLQAASDAAYMFFYRWVLAVPCGDACLAPLANGRVGGCGLVFPWVREWPCTALFGTRERPASPGASASREPGQRRGSAATRSAWAPGATWLLQLLLGGLSVS